MPLRAPRTGVGRYLTGLAVGIAARHPGVELAFFDGWRAAPTPPARAGGLDRLGQALVHRSPAAALWRPLQDRIFAARRFERGHDLYHETNFTLPPFRKPVVATVCDLSLRLHPETHPAGRVRLFESCFPRRVDGVRRCLVLSRAVAEELCAELRVPRERVRVTPPGVDPAVFHPAARGAGPQRPEAGEARPAGGPLASLPRRFLLHVGTLEPRKNLERLVGAYRRLSPALRSDVRLVLAGPRGWGAAGLLALVRDSRLEGSVVRLGYLPEPALGELYRRAEALVYPSLYEGFGLPVLEAMACGTPVVCSDIAAHRELAGEAALRVDPRDEEALAEALRAVLEDSELRKRLARLGPARALPYTWQRCADLTVDSYREALQS
jgi:alpha-1,3-rhamnosyl/mannosyltransferase